MRPSQTKKTITTACILTATLLIILTLVLTTQHTTFKKGFHQIQQTEHAHGANFKEEKLNTTMVKLDTIDPLIQQLETYAKKLDDDHTTDAEALKSYITIRTNMLKSQKHYQLGRNIGDIGLATDETGFRCSETPYMINAAYHYNKSWTYGIQALLQLDDDLYTYRNVKHYRDLIGTDDNKTKFYKSPLSIIKHFSTDTLQALTQHCNYDPTKPLQLVRIEGAPPSSTQTL